jgi:LEA14-like dessication related protein
MADPALATPRRIRRFFISLLILAVLPFAIGCEVLGALVGRPKPSARVAGVRFQGLDLESLSLVFDVELSNPYDVPIPLVDVGYSIHSGEHSVVEGRGELAGTVPAAGSRTVDVPARVVFRDLLEVVKGVKPGAVVPYTARLVFAVDAPVIGRIELPVERDGELPVPTVPDIEVASVRWKKLALDEASAAVALRVRNTNDFPLSLAKLSYDLVFSGVRVAESGVEPGSAVEPGGEAQLELDFKLSPSALGLSAFRVLSGQGADYELSGKLDVGTPWGTLRMPYRNSGETKFQRD